MALQADQLMRGLQLDESMQKLELDMREEVRFFPSFFVLVACFSL